MKHQLIALLFIAAASIFTGCGTTVAHLEKLDVEIPVAPDVHGANGEQQKPFSMRGNANISLAKTDHVNIPGIHNPRKNCQIGNCPAEKLIGKTDYVNTTYTTNSVTGNGGLDFLFKKELVLFGLGIQYNNGFFSSLSMGVNTSNFEIGVHAGLWMIDSKQTYEEVQYTCFMDSDSIYESTSTYTEPSNIEFTYGMYTSLYKGPFFVSYSLNIYKPHFSSSAKEDELDGPYIDLPYVLSHHFNIGYKYNNFLEYHIGVTRINGEFESPSPEFNTGVSLYMI